MIDEFVLRGFWQQAIGIRNSFQEVIPSMGAVEWKHRSAEGDEQLTDLIKKTAGRTEAVEGLLNEVVSQLSDRLKEILGERWKGAYRAELVSYVVPPDDLEKLVEFWEPLAERARALAAPTESMGEALEKADFDGVEKVRESSREATRELRSLIADADEVTNRLRMYVSA